MCIRVIWAASFLGGHPSSSSSSSPSAAYQFGCPWRRVPLGAAAHHRSAGDRQAFRCRRRLDAGPELGWALISKHLVAWLPLFSKRPPLPALCCLPARWSRLLSHAQAAAAPFYFSRSCALLFFALGENCPLFMLLLEPLQFLFRWLVLFFPPSLDVLVCQLSSCSKGNAPRVIVIRVPLSSS